MNINRCELSGNITRDGELRTTQGGTSVLSFGLAFNDRKRDTSGKWVDVPNYIECVIFGNYAESMERHLTKGRRVFVAGKLKWSQWTDKSDNKRSKIELIADTIDLPPTGQKKASQAAQQKAEQPTYSAPAPVEDDLYDEDIPF